MEQKKNRKNSYDIVIKVETQLDDTREAYVQLIRIYNELNQEWEKKILLDFSEVTLLSANLLAVLGYSVEHLVRSRGHRLFVRKLHAEIKDLMQRNGFDRYFNWEHIEDMRRGTMKYAIFAASTIQMEEFEKYLFINIFSRPDLPWMEAAFRDRIIDNFLEIFNNVIDHAESDWVYVCGQYFSETSELRFSIVDGGRTIRENVSDFLVKRDQPVPDNTLRWAVEPGNSTKAELAPGGLGFSMLLEFIRSNQGAFTLISGNEIYEMSSRKQRFDVLDVSFAGTIVTISINMKDNNLYLLHSDESIIVF